MSTDRYPWNGDLKGGDRAMIEFLDHFRGPEHIGLNVTLPVDGWDRYSYLFASSITRTAGQATIYTAYTVPSDERVTLVAARTYRESGDNTLDHLEIVYPAGYGAAASDLVVEAGSVDIFWPDVTGISATSATYSKGNGPLLLEPGTTVRVKPSGDGVAATEFRTRLDLVICKIIRAQLPR